MKLALVFPYQFASRNVWSAGKEVSGVNLSTFTRMAMGQARDETVVAAYYQLLLSADRETALDVLHTHRHWLELRICFEDAFPDREKAKRPA